MMNPNAHDSIPPCNQGVEITQKSVAVPIKCAVVAVQAQHTYTYCHMTKVTLLCSRSFRINVLCALI